MRSLLTFTLTILAGLLLADTYGAACGDGPLLQGYLAVIVHALGLACMAVGGAMWAKWPDASSNSKEN